MAGLSENQLVEQITEVGNRLLQPPTTTPELLDLLDEVEFLLTKVGQAPSPPVQEALLIPMKALIEDELFRHSDTNVRITIASCLNEVTRISAPTPPFDDDKMREIFELIVSSFENLSCQPGRCYSKAVLILQSVAKLRSCVMMLDLDCDPLVTKMFELFQRNISPTHPHSVLLAMVKIMSVMIQESDTVSLELLKVLLGSIRKENQSVSPASWELGAKILEGCADKLRPFILETVSSMGCCLEDYAPILPSICKPEPDRETNIIDGSSFLVSNELSGNLPRPAENAQPLKVTESCHNAPASSSGSKAEGSTSRRGRKPNSQNRDDEAGLEHEQAHQGTADDDICKSNGVTRKDIASKSEREEANGFEHKQAYHSSAIGNGSSRKGRPPKKDVPKVSGDKALKEKSDVSGASGTSGKKLPKQHKDFSGGSGNKSKTGQSKKDKVQSYDPSKNQRKRASSDDEVIETPHGRKNYKDDLVGCRIKVWWPLDRRYYEGTITVFDASMRKHHVDYDDGDEEILNLRKERWEFIGDETPTDIALLIDKQTTQPLSIMPHLEPSKEEKKEVSQIQSDEMEITPTSEIESGDAKGYATGTVLKSETPEALCETKRPKLSDGENS